MKSLMKSAAAVSTVALLALGATSVPSLAQKSYGDGCPPGVDNCRDDDDSNNRKRPRFDDDNKSGSYDGEVSDKRRADSDWKFDSNRHERRKSKDAKFRFYFGGFWYPAPYWTGAYGYAPSSRISCGEGRYIVDRRFNRVRTIECSGSTYTYVGRRDGDSWRVLVNARTGRIVSARPI